MDIRSIETSANRVLAYVTEVQNSTSKLYKPTKVRLQKLREICLQCADIIAEVTEMPDNSSSSGSESSHEDLLNKIRDLVEVASWSAVEHHIERQTVVTSDTKPAETNETPVDCCPAETKVSKTDKSKITKNDRKHAIRAYANALRKGAEQAETPPSDTDRCASLVWLWYSSRFLKSKNPNIKVIAVEPSASPVLSGGEAGSHKIQGIGAGFVPNFYDNNLVDEIIRISDEEAIDTAKLVAKTEGLAIGISGGAAVCGAIKIAQREDFTNKRLVVILPDSVERYLSTGVF